MTNNSFKRIKAAVSIGMMLSFAVIVFACIAPGIIIGKLYSENKSALNSAIDLAVKGENVLAYERIRPIAKSIADKKELLMIFFDHHDILQLVGAAETALRLSETDDKAQLVAELRDIERSFEYLMSINYACISNVF